MFSRHRGQLNPIYCHVAVCQRRGLIASHSLSFVFHPRKDDLNFTEGRLCLINRGMRSISAIAIRVQSTQGPTQFALSSCRVSSTQGPTQSCPLSIVSERRRDHLNLTGRQRCLINKGMWSISGTVGFNTPIALVVCRVSSTQGPIQS